MRSQLAIVCSCTCVKYYFDAWKIFETKFWTLEQHLYDFLGTDPCNGSG